MLPILLPGIVIGAIWALMYNPDFGIINSTLQFFDLQPRDWLGTPDLALGSIVAVDVWHWTPFCFLLLYAAVESLPSDVFEAARIDGAGAWQRFRYRGAAVADARDHGGARLSRDHRIQSIRRGVSVDLRRTGTATEVVSLTIYRRFFIEDNAGSGAAMSIVAFLALAR